MENERLKPDLSGLAEVLSGKFYYDSSPKHQTILRAYATDASVYQEKPLAVAIPKNKEDLKQLIRFAGGNGISLIPRTAGTSLAGQVVGSGIVVDFSIYFNRVLEVNTEEKWVRVEPGVIRDDLNKYLKSYGLMFGPETSTASRAMIGGMIGNNSSGLHSIVWGDTREHTLSAHVLLDDGSSAVFENLNPEELLEKASQTGREGEIYRRLQKILQNPDNQEAIEAGYPKKSISRRNTGYALDLLSAQIQRDGNVDLCKLLAGSEGTLAIVTEAKLSLIPLPLPEIGLLCVHCHSIQQALEANIIALRHQPEASELVDKYILDFTKGHPTYQYNRFFIEGDPEALLMIEFRGHHLEEVEQKAQKLRLELQNADAGYAFPLITGAEQSNLVWDVRKAGLGLIRNLPGDTQPVNLIEDCAVSPEDLPEYVAEIQMILEKYQLQASYYAHAGAGELHIEPLINLKTTEGKKAFRGVLADTAKIINRYQGSLSGEHGDGRLRGEFIETVLGSSVYELLKQVKEIFDPKGVFNRGKIVGTPPMDEFLRYQQDIPAKSIDTVFDFNHQEGILKLAEKCSGSGDCRKTHVTGGTMCPSYMATREEKDTTRARANMLRQFLTDSPDNNPFNHEELKEVMDLCLSCKACKSECPSGVDMAKMKAEFLQHYYDANGVAFRSWVIGNFTKSQKLASYVPSLYNWVIHQKLLSALVKKTIGFAPKRSLPEVGKTRLSKWIRKQKPNNLEIDSRAPKRKVILFCDEFTEFNDVGIGQTAYKLLVSLGYEVQIADHLESGRTYLSKGLVRKAKKIALQNVRRLKDLVRADVPLIGIEPSAILTFRDEYPDLVGPELREEAIALGRNSLLIDEFLLGEMQAGRIQKSQFVSRSQKIKLHGHCYQKAFHLVGATDQILSFPEGFEVEVIPSGCCGMAGSFGYEKEHFDVSMNIGELVLLPAVRETSKDVLIAAPGTSCRHQIKDGTARMSYHPVEILWDALIKNPNN